MERKEGGDHSTWPKNLFWNAMTSLASASISSTHAGLAAEESASGSSRPGLGIGGRSCGGSCIWGKKAEVEVVGTGVVPPTPRGAAERMLEARERSDSGWSEPEWEPEPDADPNARAAFARASFSRASLTCSLTSRSRFHRRSRSLISSWTFVTNSRTVRARFRISGIVTRLPGKRTLVADSRDGGSVGSTSETIDSGGGL